MRSLIEYTEQEIDALEAGPETDALVAVEAMGWERKNESWYDGEGVEGTRFISLDGVEDTASGWDDDCNYDELDEIPHYSSDISAAWLVWGRMITEDLVGFVDALQYSLESVSEYSLCKSLSPLSICKAALKAVRAMKLREVKNG